MEERLFNETEKSLMESMEIPFAVYKYAEKRISTVVLSKGFCELFGFDDPAQAYHVKDNDMFRYTHPDDTSRVSDAVYRFAAEGGSLDIIYRSRRKDSGGYDLIHASGRHVYAEDGTRLAQVWYTCEGSYSDSRHFDEGLLTELLKHAIFEENFLKARYYDHLTGLPGMTYFFELSESRRAEIRQEGGTPSLLFTDFSGMKYYNHKYGFSEGDELLRAFSRLISERFGSGNCSRIGQDHFAVITRSEGLEDELYELFRDCASLNGGRSLPVHVGIYQHWFDGIAASMACDRAKFACDAISSVYSSGFSYYNMSMKDSEEKQQYIIANLDAAIAERWIKVYYQPIVRTLNNRVCDEEALARWIDPVKGFMSPADFIPVLEEHNLIYKLDLYVVECVLQKIKTMKGAGLTLMPQSINLSRSDFDCCDIVEEISRRVDEAGISRSMINIEITESIIGRDFEFMKAQIDRFRENGFAVWMDDFGSGYSSLDVLQSIKFDLIKFDMRFMQQFNSGGKGRVILTELLRMATALGIDTVCEGVETEEQVNFLKETGCSKLQGYYFEKPIPVEKILEKYAKGKQIGFESPDESYYYDAVGRVNLHDLSVISRGAGNKFDNYFNSTPMAVIELCGWKVRFARTNQSYRDFMQRYFDFQVNDKLESFHENPQLEDSPFRKGLMQSCLEDGNIFIDEVLPGNVTVHSCMKRIAVNSRSWTTAVAVAVLSITDGEQGTTYENVAKSLAADYFSLYYVDIETEHFVEYASGAGREEIDFERHGENFFSESRRDASSFIYDEDRESFINAFTKENVLRQLEEHGKFTLAYQLLIKDVPTRVMLKATRMRQDPGHIIIGVSLND